MNDIEKLFAIEAIKQVKAKYFRFVDSKNWDGLQGLFTPNVAIDISDDVPGGRVTGSAKFVEMARGPLHDSVSVHHGHCPEIEITSESTATGVWAMEDLIRWPEGSAVPIRSLQGFGHYYESYVFVDGRWLIDSMTLKRIRVDIDPIK